jgi:hypothetical protein
LLIPIISVTPAPGLFPGFGFVVPALARLLTVRMAELVFALLADGERFIFVLDG